MKPDQKNAEPLPGETADLAAQPQAAETTASEAAPGERDIHSVIEALNAENAQLKDKVLRTLAEMENLRRRTEKEISDARVYATTNFARDILNVADNVRRALDSVPAEAAVAAEGALKALMEGIDLTERDLLKTLERHGVRKLEPKGEKFDPNLHQAMFEIPDPSVPNGTVREVVQAGFTIGDRVLRPALVGVAKGGARPGDAAARPNGSGLDKEI